MDSSAKARSVLALIKRQMEGLAYHDRQFFLATVLKRMTMLMVVEADREAETKAFDQADDVMEAMTELVEDAIGKGFSKSLKMRFECVVFNDDDENSTDDGDGDPEADPPIVPFGGVA